MPPKLLSKILSFYNLPGGSVAPRQSGYRNHSYRIALPRHADLNLIIYKREPLILKRIRNANAVSGYTSSSGLPARTLADPRILKLSAPSGPRYGSLYHYLPGTTIPWEAYTHRHLLILGQTMSNMHDKLKAAPDRITTSLPLATQELFQANVRQTEYFADSSVQRAASLKLHLEVPAALTKRFSKIITIAGRLPGKQVLHMDFVRGNLLFSDDAGLPQLTGILDFEKVALGPPIIDIARTLAFLLVDSKYKSPYHIRKYFLTSGYNKRGPASFTPVRVHTRHETINLLDELITFFLVYDLYKFMRHNPYDSLHLNEHYMRTISLLAGNGIIYPLNQVAPILS